MMYNTAPKGKNMI